MADTNHTPKDADRSDSPQKPKRSAGKIIAIAAVGAVLIGGAVGIRALEGDDAESQQEQSDVDFLSHDQTERIVTTLHDRGADVYQLSISRSHASAQVFEDDGSVTTLAFGAEGDPNERTGGSAPADAAHVKAEDITVEGLEAAAKNSPAVIDQADAVRSLSIEQDYEHFNGSDAGPSATLRASTSGEGFGTGSGTVVWSLDGKSVLGVSSSGSAPPKIAQTDEARTLLNTMPAVQAMAEDSGAQLVKALEYYGVKDVYSAEFRGTETRTAVLTKDDKQVLLTFGAGAPSVSTYTHSSIEPLEDWKKLGDVSPASRVMDVVDDLELPEAVEGAPVGPGAAVFNGDTRTPAPESSESPEPSDSSSDSGDDASDKSEDDHKGDDSQTGEPKATSGTSPEESSEPTESEEPDPIDMTELPSIIVLHHDEYGDVVFVDSKPGSKDRPAKWSLADGKPLPDEVQSAYWTPARQ